MWGKALAEIEAAFAARLGGAIDQVAAARGVVLVNTFTRYEWRGRQLDIRQFPALVIRPVPGARAAVQTNPGLREGVVPIGVGYGYQAQDDAEVQRHLEHVPEAISMIVEELDRLTDAVLGVEGDMETRWDGRILEATPGVFEAWAAVYARLRLYTDAITLA